MVLQFMRREATLSVADLSASVSLSKTTCKKILDHLASRDLVQSAGKGLSTEEGGKKPELYRFNRLFGFVISIHITPDVILTAVTDLNGDIISYSREEVGPDRSLDSILGRIGASVRRILADKVTSGQKPVWIVLSLPGLADANLGVSIYSPHYPNWGRNIPVAQMLRAAIGGHEEIPISLDCVNRYQAIAERTRGVAAGADNFIIIDAITEGLGSGVFLHGSLLQGNQSLSGEIGHMAVNPVDGVPCICGHRGCFEAMVSARRILALAEAARTRGEPSELFTLEPGRTLGLDVICEAASRGDAVALSLIDDVARWFLVGIGNIVMLTDPELIVIQGLYVRAGECFISRLREGIRHIGLPDVEKKVRIEYSTLGEDRGVLGGAAFVLEEFFSRHLTF
jgi:predicted NBD/HSP70 family sugar kinase